jgi:tetratricopeptide (TPR) repeat protein
MRATFSHNSSFLVASVIALAIISIGCSSANRSATHLDQDQDTYLIAYQAAGAEAAPGVIPPPPGLQKNQVQPRQGTSLSKAKLSLDKIIKKLKQPAYLNKVKPPEPGPVTRMKLINERYAMRYYAKARLLKKNNQIDQALVQLNQAKKLLPNEPMILQELGLLYTDAGNDINATDHLLKAVQMNSGDLPSVFWLGFNQLRKVQEPLEGHYDQTIMTLAHSQGLWRQGDDQIYQVLMPFYLGLALQQEGYDVAAIKQFQQFLRALAFSTPGTRFVRYYAPLRRNPSQAWILIGDAYMRLDEPTLAIHAYRQGTRLIQSRGFTGDLRLIYAQLRLGRADQATEIFIKALDRVTDINQALPLVKYLTRYGVDQAKLSPRLQRRYEALGRPGKMVIALSELLDPPDNWKLLSKHLKLKPKDEVVLAHLLKLCLEKPTDQSLSFAILGAAQVIQADPTNAFDHVRNIFTQVAKPRKLLKAFDQIEAQAKAQVGIEWLRGSVLARLGEDDQAIAAYERAMAGNKDLGALREKLVNSFYNREKYDSVRKLLASVADKSGSWIVPMRARLLAKDKKIDQSLNLINQYISEHPTDVDAVIAKSQIQAGAEQTSAAQQTLESAISAMPTEEKLYEHLFMRYDNIEDKVEGTRRSSDLLEKAQKQIPQAKVTRVRHASNLYRDKDYARASEALRPVLVEFPKDYEALRLFIYARHLANYQTEAAAEIKSRIRLNPKDVELLEIAMNYFSARGDAALALQYREKRAALLPAGLLRDLELAEVYRQTNRAKQAVKLLLEATTGPVENWDYVRLLISRLGRALIQTKRGDQIDKYMEALVKRVPKEHKADCVWQWSFLHEIRGVPGRSEELLLGNYKEFPEHPQTNNALAYAWATRGKNLGRAEDMLKLALKKDPDNYAYMDSLGWVYYKLGRFDEARKYLEKSIAKGGAVPQPIILDHYADTLWRLKKPKEAYDNWIKAARALQSMRQRPDFDISEDPELGSLGPPLGAKIRAYQSQEEKAKPPVAELAPLD